MKILIIALIWIGFIYGQSVPDSNQIKKENQVREQVQNQKSETKQAQKQIGPKQNQGAELKQNRKRKDVFIDKDGDGICDSRQSGMSFNKMRKRMGSGQKGPGGPGGSGSGHSSENGNMNGSSSGSKK